MPRERQPWGDRVLTREEERGLALAIRGGTEAEARAARETFAACNLPWCQVLAVRAAARWGIDPDDCFGAAQLGLVDAIGRFDPDRGTKFVTIATYSIWQAIRRHALPHAGPVSLPRHLTDGHQSSPALHAAAEAWRWCGSLDRPVPDPVDDRAEAEEAEERRAAVGRVRAVLAGLSRVEQEVMRMAYPVDGSEPRTSEQIGRELGIEKHRAKRIRDVAIEKIRRRYRKVYGEMEGAA